MNIISRLFTRKPLKNQDFSLEINNAFESFGGTAY